MEFAEKNYKIKFSGRSVELSRGNSTTLAYRIPYQTIIDDELPLTIDNNFIVYILVGKEKGNDKEIAYVGKSKNGIKHRPKAHDDKCNNWQYCYVLTQFKERTFFNDGTIQHIENELSKVIGSLNRFYNTTQQTSRDTANPSDKEYCKEYLDEALEMLFILGLDLFTNSTKDDVDEDDEESNIIDINNIPDGIYTLKRKLKRKNNEYVHARMQVRNHMFIVLADSEICTIDGLGMSDETVMRRKTAKIEDGVLKEPEPFKSPSAAGCFVIGGSCNGWRNWKCEDGNDLRKFLVPTKK